MRPSRVGDTLDAVENGAVLISQLGEASINLDDMIAEHRALHGRLHHDGAVPALSSVHPSDNDWDRADLLQVLAHQPSAFPAQRAQMLTAIASTIRARAVIDDAALQRVLRALGSVSREDFMPEEIKAFAYLPGAFALGPDQTISHPYIVAAMTLAADIPPGARVLDIGTGSGYQAAILSCLSDSVVSIEIVPNLATSASERLRHLGFDNVSVHMIDGSSEVPGDDLFDAIIVTAGSSAIPDMLFERLLPGGRIVMPIGPTPLEEQLLVFEKTLNDEIAVFSLGHARFVPLTGVGGRAMRIRGDIDKSGTIPFLYGSAITRAPMKDKSPQDCTSRSSPCRQADTQLS